LFYFFQRKNCTTFWWFSFLFLMVFEWVWLTHNTAPLRAEKIFMTYFKIKSSFVNKPYVFGFCDRAIIFRKSNFFALYVMDDGNRKLHTRKCWETKFLVYTRVGQTSQRPRATFLAVLPQRTASYTWAHMNIIQSLPHSHT